MTYKITGKLISIERGLRSCSISLKVAYQLTDRCREVKLEEWLKPRYFILLEGKSASFTLINNTSSMSETAYGVKSLQGEKLIIGNVDLLEWLYIRSLAWEMGDEITLEVNYKD